MNKFNKLVVIGAAAVAGLGLAGSALAADGLAVTGEVHGASAYQYRGQQFSDGDVSLGASVTATHSSGLFGSIKTDSVKLTDGTSRNQWQSGLTVGYSYDLPHDVKLSGGVTRNVFSGKDGVSALSNSEAFLGADWNGVHAKVATVVESAKFEYPGFSNGDTYGELGYTYTLGKVSLGGDVGYNWFNSHDYGVKDGLALAQVRIGYAVNDQVDVTVTHQFAGDDVFGQTSSGTHKTMVKLAYKF